MRGRRCHLQSHEDYLATAAESDLSPFAALPQWRVDRGKWDLPARGRCLYWPEELQTISLRCLWVEFKARCKVRRLSTTVPVFCVRCCP